MNVRKASVSRILTLLILIFFSLAIVSCRFSPKVPPATDPDTGTTNPEPEEPEISTGRQFIISFPEGVTATKRGKAFQSGSMAYEGTTITFKAPGLSESYEVSGWALFKHSEYTKTFESSASAVWTYTVNAEDAYYDDVIRITFLEISNAEKVEVKTFGAKPLPGFLLEQGIPHNVTPSEFDDYCTESVIKINNTSENSKEFNLIDVSFVPYGDSFVDVYSFFGDAPDLRLYYYSSHTDPMDPIKDVVLIGDEAVDCQVFSFCAKIDPEDGKKKLYLKDKLDNTQSGLPDPRIFAIQGNRWFAINLLLISPTQIEIEEQNSKVEAKIASLLETEFKGLETDFGKVKAVHDYIIDTVTWGRIPGRFLDAQTAYGALIQNTCVCQGYARAFKQIMDKMGIESKIIIGNSGFHAWNKVKVDKKWYQIDLTWDDYDGANGIYRVYKNFLKSDATMIDTKHYGFSDTELCDEDYPLPWEKKTE